MNLTLSSEEAYSAFSLYSAFWSGQNVSPIDATAKKLMLLRDYSGAIELCREVSDGVMKGEIKAVDAYHVLDELVKSAEDNLAEIRKADHSSPKPAELIGILEGLCLELKIAARPINNRVRN